MHIISDTCLSLGGATIIPGCLGVYTHENGEKVVEPSVQVIIYGAAADNVKRLARRLAIIFNQESIAYEYNPVVSEFITAE